MAANYRKFRRIISIGAVSLVMALFAIPLVSATEALSIGDADREQRIAWHRAARYGAMVHFSPDTIGKLYHYDGAEVGDPYRGRPIPAAEFARYYHKLTLQNFDADAWMKAFADAGMKYFVFVAKHHNGFALWDSKYTNYDIYSVTGRDMVAELAEAARKYGIKLCLYYSIMDWYHPHATGDSHGGKGYELPPGIEPDLENYILFMKAQLKELATNYGDIGLLWYDGAWMSHWTDNPKLQWTDEHARDLYQFTLGLQQGMIANNRMQKKHYEMTELGDYYTPENFIANFDQKNHWESVIKLGDSWHWRPNQPVMTLANLKKTLSRTVGNDGNLLLNLAPHPDGFIEPERVQRIREMGDWLKVNGAAFYGARGGPYLPSDRLSSTHRGDTVYLHLYQKPVGGVLRLPAPKLRIKSVSANGQPLKYRISKNGLSINLSRMEWEEGVTIVSLRLKGSAADIPVMASGKPAEDHGIDTSEEIEQENL